MPAEGQTGACVEQVPLDIVRGQLAAPSTGIGPATPLPIPSWCVTNAGKGIFAVRTLACSIFRSTYSTFRVVNGVRVDTGVATIDVYNLAYTVVDQPLWGHQVQVATVSAWGDAGNASVEGSASGVGACQTNSSLFPGQPLLPYNTLRTGEASFRTTATAIGAVGHCTTNWNVVFTNPGYNPAGMNVQMTDIRCDNATGANGFNPRTVGCVVPWYASAVTYDYASTPWLAYHVSKAITSGLPGGTFAQPLTRTTNQAIIDRNRALACGDAPSIPGWSCDEYPLASTNQGLSAGGTRRTFDSCSLNFPRETGPVGVSVCMIPLSENNSQGGTQANFYYRERVLDGDPFRTSWTTSLTPAQNDSGSTPR